MFILGSVSLSMAAESSVCTNTLCIATVPDVSLALVSDIVVSTAITLSWVSVEMCSASSVGCRYVSVSILLTISALNTVTDSSGLPSSSVSGSFALSIAVAFVGKVWLPIIMSACGLSVLNCCSALYTGERAACGNIILVAFISRFACLVGLRPSCDIVVCFPFCWILYTGTTS